MYFHRKSKTRYTTDLLWNIWFLKIFVEHWIVKMLLVYDVNIILLLPGSLFYHARRFITLLKHSWEQKFVGKSLNSMNNAPPLPSLQTNLIILISLEQWFHSIWCLKHFVYQDGSIFSSIDGVCHRGHPLVPKWRHRLPNSLQAARSHGENLRGRSSLSRELLVHRRDLDHPPHRARTSVYSKEFLHR